MLIDYFKQYMKITRGITDKSVGHYMTGINSINALLEKYDFPIKNIFFVESIVELDTVKAFLENNDEFQQKDSVGHHMYSVAFKHFYRFVCEDNSFFNNNISKMDIVIAKPKTATTNTTKWRRNQIVISQAIEGANHTCEYNNRHETFISKTTGLSYMEGHHLIPMKHQDKFTCGIDVYANVVCLCPVCHRLLHHGRDQERIYVAERLFEQRSSRLANSGIDLSKNDFLELVIL